MSTPYEEIMELLKKVEKEKDIPSGILKKIYDIERNVVDMVTRDSIEPNLIAIIRSLSDKA